MSVPKGAQSGRDTSLETALAVFEHERIAAAMLALPELWRTVLWRAEVLGEMPWEIAQHAGIDPRSVSQVLILARRGLRRAFEQQDQGDKKPPERLS